MTSRSILPLAIGAVALVVAACGGDDSSEPRATEPTLPPVSEPIDLEGRVFLSTAVEGHDLVEGSRIRLSFEEPGMLSVNAGCNTIFGGYEVDGDRLVAGQLGTTEMACERDLMDQDRWLTDVLTLGPRLALDGDTLTITGVADTSITLLDRRVADPDRPLEGTRWVVDGLRTQDAVSTLPEDVVASITIADGEAVVEAGCNRGMASVEIGEGTITFGPMALTKMACEPEVMEVEALVVATLTGETTYVITADRLVIDSADTPMDPADGEMGGTGLMLVAATE